MKDPYFPSRFRLGLMLYDAELGPNEVLRPKFRFSFENIIPLFLVLTGL